MQIPFFFRLADRRLPVVAERPRNFKLIISLKTDCGKLSLSAVIAADRLGAQIGRQMAGKKRRLLPAALMVLADHVGELGTLPGQ